MAHLPSELTSLIISYLPNSQVLNYLINKYLFIYKRTSLSLAKDIVNRNKTLLDSAFGIAPVEQVSINFIINTIPSTKEQPHYKNKPYYIINYNIFYKNLISNTVLIYLLTYIFTNNLITQFSDYIIDLDKQLRQLGSKIRINQITNKDNTVYYEISVVKKIILKRI